MYILFLITGVNMYHLSIFFQIMNKLSSENILYVISNCKILYYIFIKYKI